ncbi:hypothetical protein EV127DRAFT_467809 [Xylaria flabelliformis]|nr:hypothetical protein EV127DRAFT_467809 [Xylaria flabelliformis]
MACPLDTAVVILGLLASRRKSDATGTLDFSKPPDPKLSSHAWQGTHLPKGEAWRRGFRHGYALLGCPLLTAVEHAWNFCFAFFDAGSIKVYGPIELGSLETVSDIHSLLFGQRRSASRRRRRMSRRSSTTSTILAKMCLYGRCDTKQNYDTCSSIVRAIEDEDIALKRGHVLAEVVGQLLLQVSYEAPEEILPHLPSMLDTAAPNSPIFATRPSSRPDHGRMQVGQTTELSELQLPIGLL